MEEQTIQDVMPKLLIDGSFFKYLPTFGTSTPLQLGLAYCLHHSGQKIPTRLVKRYIDEDTGTITYAGEEAIGQILSLIFGDNWDKKYKVLNMEYNPIENYSMTEEGLDAHTGQDTLTRDLGEQSNTRDYGSRTDTENLGATKDTDTMGSTERITLDEKNGFNEGLTADSKITENENDHVNLRESAARENKRVSNAYTDIETYGAKTDTDTQKYDNQLIHKLTRSGNVGVTTSQQMIQSELDIRDYIFFEQMFSDIDSYLTLSVY